MKVYQRIKEIGTRGLRALERATNWMDNSKRFNKAVNRTMLAALIACSIGVGGFVKSEYFSPRINTQEGLENTIAREREKLGIPAEAPLECEFDNQVASKEYASGCFQVKIEGDKESYKIRAPGGITQDNAAHEVYHFQQRLKQKAGKESLIEKAIPEEVRAYWYGITGIAP